MKYYPSYKSLLNKNKDLTYSDLLTAKEWKIVRDRILERDSCKCIVCNSLQTEYYTGKHSRKITEEERTTYLEKAKANDNKIKIEWEKKFNTKVTGSFIRTAIPTEIIVERPIVLHIHHKYYIKGHLPWEYDDECFMTVCHNCHLDIHQESQIVMYSDLSKTEVLSFTTCPRCYGAGIFPEYHHVQSGICFYCHGAKFLELI